MITYDIIRFSKRIKLLNKIDHQDVALFNSDPYFAVPAVSALLSIPEKDIMAKMRLHEHISVDLEFHEADSTHVVHDGVSATGRPIVLGLTWRGLKMICAEFNSPKINQLAKDIVTVEYMASNPRTLAHYFSKKDQKGSEPKTSML